MLRKQITKRIISAALVLALGSFYFTVSIKVLCSLSLGESMSCCKFSENSDKICGEKKSNTLAIKSAHSCPCPSMQTGQNENLDEVLPVSNFEFKFQLIASAPLSSKMQNANVSELLITGYFHSFLTSKDRLSLLQTFLI
jgi:hypothetical protein